MAHVRYVISIIIQVISSNNLNKNRERKFWIFEFFEFRGFVLFQTCIKKVYAINPYSFPESLAFLVHPNLPFKECQSNFAR